jgi:hypothetical protein
MLKVENKFILIGLVGIAFALIFAVQFTFLHLCTTFVWWEIIIFYLILVQKH